MARFFANALLSLWVAILCLPGSTPLQAQTQAPTVSVFATLAAKAEAARDSDRLDEAVVLYRKALALRPEWVEGWWSLGTIQYERNGYREAAETFQKVVALSPKAGMGWAMLGLCEFELGRDDDALRHIQQGKGLGITDDAQLQRVVLFHEGTLLQRRGWFKEARSKLRSLCWAGPDNPELIRTLGMVALQISGKEPPATRFPDAEILARVGRAECLAGRKNYEEARRDYDAVAKDYPAYPNIHYAYGWFLLESRNLPAGFQELELEIKNNPRHVMARLQMASNLYRVDSAAALPYAEQAVKLDPDLPLGHYILGLLLLDTDDYLRAIPELEAVLRSSPGDAKIYLALGSAYARAGREEDAARARAAFQRMQHGAAKDSEPLGAPETATDTGTQR